MMSQPGSRQQDQLSLINPIDHQPGYYAAPAEAPVTDPTWSSPRTAPGNATYGGEVIAEAPALAIEDTVQVLPFTDAWGFARGQYDQAVVTAIHGDRITLAIPGVVTREGYVCGIERVQKL